MGTILKNLLIKQIINHPEKIKIISKYKDMRTNYRYMHKENLFTVSLSCNIINNLDRNARINLQTETEQILFNVKRDVFIKSVLESIKHKPLQNLESQKIVIDFSSPNIAKPFHVGHLRSTIIGNFIGNINEYFYNDVVRLNYLGDWGTQFGLLQCGLKLKNITTDKLSNDPIKILYEAYVEANKLSQSDETIRNEAKLYFSDIEQGRTSLSNWRKIRQITVQELDKTYNRLGVKFDDYHWESDYNGEAIKNIMESLELNNLMFMDTSGKKVIKVNDRNVTVLKSDNTSLYLSRDIAALLDRYKRYKFDKMLYVVDNSQTDHFATLLDIVSQIDEDCTKGCEHIKFGRIKGMSTRNGNVVFLNDILDEAKQKMYEKQKESRNTRNSAINEETCDILGITAVLINDLKQKRQKDYLFEWDKALQSEGDSGIKLQYLHCRLWSLESNCGVKLPDICEPQYISEEIVGNVITELAKFEDVLQKALIENEACIIVNYLFRLARHINRMFNELKVKDVNNDLGSQRLLVFHSARIVIKTALEILGVKPLYQM